ncbi:MAG: methyltransferase [bacterium]|nr:methyltransferase [bacterium]
MNHYSTDTRNALQAKEYAQWISFAPFIFQASRILRDSGILEAIRKSGKGGVTLEAVAEKTELSIYGARVLMEAGLGIGLILVNEGKYKLTNVGVVMLVDTLTRVNMDFTNDICYEGLKDLQKSIKTGKPEGLHVLGNWNTIYEGLSILPEPARTSWFNFDHFYSDSAFEEALDKVLQEKPYRLLDIGGNTGKWATACVTKDPNTHVTIFDLPVQAAVARKNVISQGLENRISFHEADILKEDAEFPGNFDGIWMSQFLDCFSDEQIVSILTRCSKAVTHEGYVYVLETFWDRQRFEASAFCLQMTSLYFTTMANGNSQMYDSKVFLKLLEQSGLSVVEISDNIGISHSLIKCKKVK